MNRNKISIAFLSLMTLSGLLTGAYAQSGVMLLPEQPLPANTTVALPTTAVPTAHPMPTPTPSPRHLGHVTHVQIMPAASMSTVTSPAATAAIAPAPVALPQMYSMSGFISRPMASAATSSFSSTPAPTPHPTVRTYAPSAAK